MATIYQRGKIWWGRFQYKGHEFRQSLETAARSVALRRLAKWERETKAQAWGEGEGHTYDEAMESFLDNHCPTLRESSRRRYEVSAKQLTPFFTGMADHRLRAQPDTQPCYVTRGHLNLMNFTDTPDLLAKARKIVGNPNGYNQDSVDCAQALLSILEQQDRHNAAVDRMIEICENPPPPSEALVNLMASVPPWDGGFDCHACFKKAAKANPTLFLMTRMILCPECGNKRCPKASNHELACTRSNEPGQPGSIY